MPLDKPRRGYRVEYSEDENEVCIIPMPALPMEDFFELTSMYIRLGYKWWLPADDRRGYLISKEKKENYNFCLPTDRRRRYINSQREKEDALD
jgi:hypothetical protein